MLRMAVFVLLLNVFAAGCAEDKSTNPESQKSNQAIDSKTQAQVIYGDDNRKEVFQVRREHQELARSTVALVSRFRVLANGSRVRLDAVSFGSSQNLCSSERFFNQKVAAFCSGALVAPDLILTAGHCLQTAEDCADTAFVFGFEQLPTGQSRTTLPIQDVYTCKEIVRSRLEPSGLDYALVRLDRAVRGRTPLKVAQKTSVREGQKLRTIGHPSGLPVKITDEATVRSIKGDFFTTNLDTYGGNSGSPVFDESNTIQGVLVRGENDFEWRGSCKVSKRCGSAGCRGEDVTKVDSFRSFIQ